MTGVSNNNSIGTAPLPTDSNASLDGSNATNNADGSLTVISPGGDVVATHSDPLPVVAIPVAVMPGAVEIALVAVSPAPTENAASASGIWSTDIKSAGDWTAQKVELGRAVIDIDSVYRLSINDILAEVLLENRETNVVTRIWGDAQVSINGQDVGQFWGNSSFQLGNGTLITANTVISPDNPSAYMLDKLVITRDECGFVVTGISNETTGDLNIAFAANATVYDHVQPTPAPITEAIITPDTVPETVAEAAIEAPATTNTANGELAPKATTDAPTTETAPATSRKPDPILLENKDAVTAAVKAEIDGYDMDDDQRDGLVFVETANGWIDEWDDQAISAAVLAQTMPGGEFSPNSDIMSRSEFNTVINRFISIMTTQSFMSNISMRNSEFQSQLRDTATDQDRITNAKDAEERAARERQIMMGLMEAGSIAADLINRYRGVDQSITKAA